MPFPFEVGFDKLQSDIDAYVDAVFGCLESDFLVMPKGKGFVEFPVFEDGYEALKRATGGFRDVTPDTVASVVFQTPIAFIVLRCMLGFTPPEWAYFATRHTGVEITQGSARSIDRPNSNEAGQGLARNAEPRLSAGFGLLSLPPAMRSTPASGNKRPKPFTGSTRPIREPEWSACDRQPNSAFPIPSFSMNAYSVVPSPATGIRLAS